MKKIDIVGIAFGNFRRRKTRSLLTVLGVVIGVASIVVMVSLGIAINVFFEAQTAQMGDLTTISVQRSWDQNGTQTGKLTDDIVEQLKQLENVVAVSPELNVNGKIAAGKYLGYANIIGVTADNLARIGLKVDTGTFDGFADSTKKDIKCVIGPEVAYSMYNPRAQSSGGMIMGGMSFGGMGGGDGEAEREPPPVDLFAPDAKLKFTFDYSYGEKKQPGMDVGPVKKPTLYKMTPIAQLKPNNSSQYNIYIDMEIAKQLKKDQDKQNQQPGSQAVKKTEFQYDSIKVITGSIEETLSVTNKIKKDFGREAYSSAEVISGMQNTADMLQLILGGIGSISLLVAAIGITNTMIMSIYERTKEIGVMKVIGCQLKDIRTMFLCEAGFIGLFGGAVGLIISYTISFIINKLTAGGDGGGLGGMLGLGFMGEGGAVKMSIIPPWLSVLAVVFAIIVGLVSGFLPARRAMKLSALEAMRN